MAGLVSSGFAVTDALLAPNWPDSWTGSGRPSVGYLLGPTLSAHSLRPDIPWSVRHWLPPASLPMIGGLAFAAQRGSAPSLTIDSAAPARADRSLPRVSRVVTGGHRARTLRRRW
ncbi:hypothetical protein A6P39_005105 [Streptomyces sp. FXJ1.172]|uniref:hypothetical protein n=1 Tax=Streptomyces sp. FXJ1.172 TaxID=710705 RepID=UPI0007CF9AAA|nr:hypothetical protein [Streptomyces sp. FXJ1.172]WEO93447.1 hypothetical protein A6P39_005105 [Streptomyces sp. FXJ1.172]